MAGKFKVGVEALGLLHADGHAAQGFAIDDDEVVADVHTDAPFFVGIAAAAAPPSGLTTGDKNQRTAVRDDASAIELDGNGEAAPNPISAAITPVAADRDPPPYSSAPEKPKVRISWSLSFTLQGCFLA